jgi:dienelactone hydrolase
MHRTLVLFGLGLALHAGAAEAKPKIEKLTVVSAGRELRSKLPIDGRRIYLFGHSAGAVFALEMASLESEYFAAVAVHAGALESQYQNVFLYARRKTPIFMVVGTKDVFFLQPTVRGTRDALAARGFPVELVEIYNHTHDYYGRSGEINAMAWKFLSRHELPGDPKYTEYAR